MICQHLCNQDQSVTPFLGWRRVCLLEKSQQSVFFSSRLDPYIKHRGLQSRWMRSRTRRILRKKADCKQSNSPPPLPREQTHTPGTSPIKKKVWPIFRQMAFTICKEISGENFPSHGTRIFLEQKTGTGLNCAWIVLELTSGTGNPNNCYRKFRSFRWQRKKGNTSKGMVLLFFRKKSTTMNRSIWILPGIFWFSIQMVSAQGFINTTDGPMSWICI